MKSSKQTDIFFGLRQWISRSLIGAAILSLSALTLSETDTEATDASVSISFKELQLFADTFDAIRRGYVEEVTDAELFEMLSEKPLSKISFFSYYEVASVHNHRADTSFWINVKTANGNLTGH